ncbi:hypothetical protein BDV27DRAFT_157118 [Aspergillus caelatus]|uniref:Uncharacterized protein n=1 Tax=Aspergillus caelatus TaxID=61420 RepID=A0A5N7A666_9EURO|nr:uncharacterized protein BDV27DRAFT_157118 [Aspergillus caelatus]KAE8365205.1 hypothetical protein BDV27DRAFT_157118 [Aspergillus caelatus]
MLQTTPAVCFPDYEERLERARTDTQERTEQHRRKPNGRSRRCSLAHDLTRLEALATWKDKCIALYLFPYLSSYLADGVSKTIVGATKLDCVPLPPRSLQCTMPFTNSHPPRDGAIWKRVLWTLPWIGIYAAEVNGEVLSLTKPLYHNLFLDKLSRPLITCFLPSITGSDPNSRVQMLSFMTDLGSVYGIWLLESYRNAHSWTSVLLPLTAGTAFQLKGIWMIAPFYYTLEYLITPLSTLLSGSSSKEIDAVTTESLVLSTLAGYYSTIFANFFAPSLRSRQCDGIASFLQYDDLLSMARAYVWLGLRFRELKQAGARFSWTRAAGAFVASVLALGPGATFALVWEWREELLHQVAEEL